MNDTPENHTSTNHLEREFVANNAEFFAQAFMSLSETFNSAGAMKIVSEETKRTLVTEVSSAFSDGSRDINCVLLKPSQESLRNCLNTL